MKNISDTFYGSVTVGERGQIVIPAEARAEQGIKPGDKLIVMIDPVHKCIMVGKLEHMKSVIDQYTALFEKAAAHVEGDEA